MADSLLIKLVLQILAAWIFIELLLGLLFKKPRLKARLIAFALCSGPLLLYALIVDPRDPYMFPISLILFAMGLGLRCAWGAKNILKKNTIKVFVSRLDSKIVAAVAISLSLVVGGLFSMQGNVSHLYWLSGGLILPLLVLIFSRSSPGLAMACLIPGALVAAVFQIPNLVEHTLFRDILAWLGPLIGIGWAIMLLSEISGIKAPNTLFFILCVIGIGHLEFGMHYGPINRLFSPLGLGNQYRMDDSLGWVPVNPEDPDGPPMIPTDCNGEYVTPEQALQPLVIVLGGSQAEGASIDDCSHKIPAVLQNELRSRGRPAFVLNAAVPGYASKQILESYLNRMQLYSPDLIIVDASYNDGFRTGWTLGKGRPPENAAMLPARRAMSNPLQGLAVYQLIYHAVRPIKCRSSDHLRADKIATSFAQNLAALVESAKSRNSKVLFVVEPVRDIPYRPVRLCQNEMRKLAESNDIPIVDADYLLRELCDQDCPCFMDSVHLTEHGTQILTNMIADSIVERELIPKSLTVSDLSLD